MKFSVTLLASILVINQSVLADDSANVGQQVGNDVQAIISQLQANPNIQSLISQYNSATGAQAQSIYSRVLTAANGVASGAASLIQVASMYTHPHGTSQGGADAGVRAASTFMSNMVMTHASVEQVNPSNEPVGPHVSAGTHMSKGTGTTDTTATTGTTGTTSTTGSTGTTKKGSTAGSSSGLEIDTSMDMSMPTSMSMPTHGSSSASLMLATNAPVHGNGTHSSSSTASKSSSASYCRTDLAMASLLALVVVLETALM